MSSLYFLGTSRISRQPWGTWGTRCFCEYWCSPCPPGGTFWRCTIQTLVLSPPGLCHALYSGGLKGNSDAPLSSGGALQGARCGRNCPGFCHVSPFSGSPLLACAVHCPCYDLLCASALSQHKLGSSIFFSFR